MADKILLILLRCSGKPDEVTIPGSVRVTAGCGCECWLSPSGLATQLAMDTDTVCMAHRPTGPVEVGEITPMARDEIARAVGPVMAEHLIDVARKHLESGRPL